jgi:carboxyl-terminal processing protease
VAHEVMKLKEEKVDGIVIDLRYNPGGSLTDVVQMVGLFIDQGPVVQVRDRDGKPQILRDIDKSVLYDGPLAVMVNEYSASASEIFAAAIQDYKRGVIIGSTSTYGKGTVQRGIPLDSRAAGYSENGGELGTVKLTLQKFYRINGGSTQLRGVASDIVLPDYYEYSKTREKDNPDALPWDEIQKAEYTPWKYAYDLSKIKNASNERMKNSTTFTQISKDAEWIEKQNDKLYPLNLEKYRAEQKELKAAYKQIEALGKLPDSAQLNIVSLSQDMAKYNSEDKDKSERYKQWVKSLKSDVYLDEAVKIVDNMVADKSVVYNK